MELIRKVPLKELAVFVIFSLIFVFSLVLVALIPQNKIEKNTLQSAEYLCSKPQFFNLIDGVKSTRLDRYADSILLGIAWQYDAEHPLESTMTSSYYTLDYQNENENLLEALRDHQPANQQYLRYWHGSNTIVRPLLMLTSIKGIYLINAVVLTLLLAILIFQLIRDRYYIPLAGLIISLLMTSVWVVPFSLEYTWTIHLMLLASIVILILNKKEKSSWYASAFLAFGMLTCFFDFLTTETLTLTVPLVLLLWIERDMTVKCYLKMTFAWGVGYVSTWLLKWLLASLVIGENALPYVSEHVAERIGGTQFVNLGIFSYLLGALARNLGCLFPFGYGIIGVLLGISLIIVYLYLAYVYRGKKIDKRRIGLFVIIALVPYVRYLVLHNHAYLHYFFTYRAQMATVLALIFVLDEMMDWGQLRRKRVHGKN
ncbi:hypothetical protein SAMN02910369_03095 [Lachnospiraceae bacterium NE2001]|nr:hypothetical protein SAMN02910369_03095 [Lachnospiraceae bacterium NE2001]